MATTSRAADTSIEEILAARPHQFSFFQAMRLLLMLAAKSSSEDRVACKVRVVPELSLAFPPADVAGIEKTPDGYKLKVTFLGLYGQSSPLPTFYTEQLIEEAAADVSAARDFLDIINHHLYTLFHDCTLKNWLYFQVSQQAREDYLELLFCLAGLGGKQLRHHLPDPKALLRYAGLLTQHPRSALGLERLLSDALEVPVKVVQCQKRRIAVPADQRLQLGVDNATLGEDAVVGSEVSDASTMFRIKVGPLTRDDFSAYLPGTLGRDWLDSLVEVYLSTPLSWEVELEYAASEAPTTALGGEIGGRLGWDSWIGPKCESGVSVVFPQQSSHVPP